MFIGALKDRCKRIAVHPRMAKYTQFVKFGVVGIANTLISLCLYWVCHYLLRMHYQIANLIAFIVSVINAYYWNNRHVFIDISNKSFKQRTFTFGKVIMCYSVTYLLSVLLLIFWVRVLRISIGIAPILNLFITVPLNFLLNKHWAFRGGENK